jgi:XTP/dITP diphosphohydrolase
MLPRPIDVPEVVEDSGTLVGNARLKAVAICTATGLPAVADDTGLFVAALDGAPGVDTAYFAGPTATHAENRDSSPRTATARIGRREPSPPPVAWPDGEELVVEGVCAADRRRRTRWGGGYDPLCRADGDGRTFAEMSAEGKHAHRTAGRSPPCSRRSAITREPPDSQLPRTGEAATQRSLPRGNCW